MDPRRVGLTLMLRSQDGDRDGRLWNALHPGLASNILKCAPGVKPAHGGAGTASETLARLTGAQKRRLRGSRTGDRTPAHEAPAVTGPGKSPGSRREHLDTGARPRTGEPALRVNLRQNYTAGRGVRGASGWVVPPGTSRFAPAGDSERRAYGGAGAFLGPSVDKK
ncbi:hypothetical protein NDU88_008214 [Pleurodeles waltl]|uniref:Uncharacterized protein n=1 Tax=Pleurodeles waltl TaxID=8319 RepID=A0AAV7VV50_PLEWA|nr:hypothetical protein NDU88_008214 [Pleurodeles waltl]